MECIYIYYLVVGIVILQKTEPMVLVVYDLLHLIWKTNHFSSKSKLKLYSLGQELGVDMDFPHTQSYEGSLLLGHGQDKDLASDHDQ